MTNFDIATRACALAVTFAIGVPVVAQADSDTYLRGYVVAVLEREFAVTAPRVEVRNGVVRIGADDPGTVEKDRIVAALTRVPGVVRIEWNGTSEPAIAPAADDLGSTFLRRQPLLFEPLHADPRWPHFSASYQRYASNDVVTHGGAVGFGESFSVYRRDVDESFSWEIGLQAGVFAIFDLAADSSDLVNADYFVGPVFAMRHKDLSLLARVYHQSSHLGDEYLLRTAEERINLSYEVVDVIASIDFAESLRAYGGAGYIVHSEPKLEPWLFQAGAEWFGPRIGGGTIRPLVVSDLQWRDEHDFEVDVSFRAGIQFEDPSRASSRLQFLLEAYKGRSPHGQFYDSDVEYLGFGIHFYF